MPAFIKLTPRQRSARRRMRRPSARPAPPFKKSFRVPVWAQKAFEKYDPKARLRIIRNLSPHEVIKRLKALLVELANIPETCDNNIDWNVHMRYHDIGDFLLESHESPGEISGLGPPLIVESEMALIHAYKVWAKAIRMGKASQRPKK